MGFREEARCSVPPMHARGSAPQVHTAVPPSPPRLSRGHGALDAGALVDAGDDFEQPSSARVNDFLLGGTSHGEVDRLLARDLVHAEPLVVPGRGSVQLGDAGLRIEGSFEAGLVHDVTLTFDNGEEVSLGVPVMAQCDQYDGFDDAPGAPTGDPYS